MKRKGFWGGIAYGFFLTALTVFILLDTFVFTSVYSQAESESPVNAHEPVKDELLLPLVKTLDEYNDGQIIISIDACRGFDSDIYVANIHLSDPTQLKTAFAQDSYGKNVKEQPSATAERVRAILAINGDYYSAQERGDVLRNGVIYRSSRAKGREDLVIDQDGTFGVIHEQDISLQSLLDQGADQVLSFGPALVQNREVSVQADDLRVKDKTRNPRTAIGRVGELHYLFVVADGRTEASEGLTILELAGVMEALGAETAYNLDGGGSSCMVFGDRVINQPTTSGSRTKEREVSDIVYVGY